MLGQQLVGMAMRAPDGAKKVKNGPIRTYNGSKEAKNHVFFVPNILFIATILYGLQNIHFRRQQFLVPCQSIRLFRHKQLIGI